MAKFFGESSLADTFTEDQINMSPSLAKFAGPGPKKASRLKQTVTDNYKKMAEKDTFTKSIFGDNAASIYSFGFRPTNIDGEVVYAPTGYADGVSGFEGGGKVGFVKEKNSNKMRAVRIKPDGKFERFGGEGFEQMEPESVVEMMNKFYTGRFNELTAKM